MTRSRVRWAHIPGGGPAGKTCGDCRHCVPHGRGVDWACKEAARMAGLGVDQTAGICRSNSACKYFRERPPC